jgi:ribosome-associated protein
MDREEHDPESSRPNKTALKRAAKEIENVAEQLAGESDDALAGLELSAELHRELELVRRAKGRSALRRQVKHLAGVLRRRPAEAAAVQAHLERRSEQHWSRQRVFHQLEKWRDRLCDKAEAEAALEELAGRAPGLDLKELAKLSRAAGNGDKAAARQIFRRLREVAEQLS